MKQELALQIIQQNKDSYNKVAEDFSRTRRFFWKDLAFILKYTTQKDKVLDLGCGNGRLYQALGKCNYTGIDNSERLIEIAKETGGNFMVADVFSLPFEDNTFDKVYSIAVLHHIPSKELRIKFLKEAERVLKENGVLILTVWKVKMRKIFKYYKKGMDFKDIFFPFFNQKRYLHCFSQRELKKLIKKSGFLIQESGQTAGNLFIISKKV